MSNNEYLIWNMIRTGPIRDPVYSRDKQGSERLDSNTHCKVTNKTTHLAKQ